MYIQYVCCMCVQYIQLVCTYVCMHCIYTPTSVLRFELCQLMQYVYMSVCEWSCTSAENLLAYGHFVDAPRLDCAVAI